MRLSDMAFDMGTANSLAWVSGDARPVVVDKNVVADEDRKKQDFEEQKKDKPEGQHEDFFPLGLGYQVPSWVAREAYHPHKLVAVGQDAYRMLGRTPFEQVSVVQPIQKGRITDRYGFLALMQELIRIAKKTPSKGRNLFGRPTVIVGVPLNATSLERSAVKLLIEEKIKAKPVLISEPVGAAIGTGQEFKHGPSSIVIDSGGGTTDIAAVSFCYAHHDSLEIGGDTFTEAIQHYVRREHKVRIGIRTAEGVKRELACAIAFPTLRKADVKGRAIDNGEGPRVITLDSEQIRECLEKPINDLIEGVARKLSAFKADELASDMKEVGAAFTGGTSLVYGLDQLLAGRLNAEVRREKEPFLSFIRGARVIMENPVLCERFALEI